MLGDVGQVLDTTDFDAALAALTGSYSPHQLCLAGNCRAFNAKHFSAGFDGLSIHTLGYGADVRAETLPFAKYVLLSQVKHGRYRIRSNEGERLLSQGEIAILDPYTSYSMDFLDDCKMLQIRIDIAPWDRAVSQLLGCDDPRLVRFSIAADVDDEHQARCRSVMNLVANEAIPQDWVGRTQLLRGQIIQLCVAAMLESPMLSSTSFPTGRSVPNMVKRALNFFEKNCTENIGLIDVAVALKVSPRTLQTTFQRELGVSPMAALREIRMRHAYAALKEGTPGSTSVTQVALEWGFANLGRFAKDFRKRFDQHPNEVLRS